jgi:methylmalonyl-CoA mutase cobalamin-binding subunit
MQQLEGDDGSKEDEAKDVDTIMVAQINEKVVAKLKEVIPINEEKGVYQYEVKIGPIIVSKSDNEGIVVGKLIKNKEPKVEGTTQRKTTCKLQLVKYELLECQLRT